MDGIDEVIEEFLVECYESLDELDSDLLALEDTPEDLDRLASIFRTVHTIKGTSGFLAFPKLEKVAHVGESLLVPLRDGDFALTHNMASNLLEMVDAIRDILTHIETEGSEGEQTYEDQVARLEVLKHGPAAPAETEAQPAAEASEASETVAAETPSESSPSTSAQLETEIPVESKPTSDKSSAVSVESEVPPQPEAANSADSEPAAEPIAEQPTETSLPEKDTLPETATPTSSVAEPKKQPPKDSPQKTKETASTETTDRSHSVADSSVRINVDLLDKLMNLVGELVLARNQILQFSETNEDPTLITASQRLNLITTELQEGVMKTRMQPISNAWSKLPRVVRDLSASCNKNVKVVMEGADTELDKTILEAIKDPLTHIVRNSVDHGIEDTDTRLANGKSEEGVLTLRAFHEGGQVNIEITDDGGGINADRVRAKAIEKELITAEQAESMGERELTNLILLPGFSTAAKVTNVSGRGVGMDVVKTNIERIGGTIDIQSAQGKGTTLRIKIPLTLAIVPALIVTTAGDQYAIPQVSLQELVRLDGERAQEQIEFIHDTPVYRLRGNLLPLVYLDEQLELRAKRSRDEDLQSINIVVLQAENQQFGLIVETITDTQEIVVKPLGKHFKNLKSFAGATIMGDGTVALILDVLGIAQKSSVLTTHSDRSMRTSSDSSHGSNGSKQSLLIVDPGDHTRAAIPLDSVARLEEFDSKNVERSGTQDVVQYRGNIMPLIYLNGCPPVNESGEATSLNTVVFANGDRSVGIVVGQIMDIVHEHIETNDGELPHRCVVHDRVTEIINLPQLVRSSHPEIFDTACIA